MIVIMKQGASEEAINAILDEIKENGLKADISKGEKSTIIGMVGDTSVIDRDKIQNMPDVERILAVQEPYKLTNRKFHPEDTVVDVKGVQVGGKKLAVIAGPCSVESQSQISEVAVRVRDAGASLLRGGAYKPRSSPYAFQGLEKLGVELLRNASMDSGLPIVTEITSAKHLEMFEMCVDVIQIGARNMQNFELLKELGQTNIPVLLKRGFANTLEEFLMSAEYLMAGGNENVILCERGIRTYETYTRNTLDISAVPALKRMSHLPVIVDPSHAGGIYWMVEPLAKAAVAAGADGLMIEVHNDPARALSDGAQSLTYTHFERAMDSLRAVANAVGREI